MTIPGNHSLDSTLLTDSSDEEAGAVGGSLTAFNLLSATPNGFSADKCPEDLASQINSLDALSLGSTDSENDRNMNRQSGFSFGEDGHELPTSGENLIEYSEILVPATKSYSAAMEETGVLLNLLEDMPASSSTNRALSIKSRVTICIKVLAVSINSFFYCTANRMSYCQPIKSASVLETLLEPPRISSGSLVSYLTQSSSGSNTPRSRVSSSKSSSNNNNGVSVIYRSLPLSIFFH